MSNQLWCEVFDANDTSLGMVGLMQASLTRALDGAGQISLSPMTGDDAANELLQMWRKAAMYYQHPVKGKTLIGSGFLLQKTFADSAGAPMTAWSGMDEMEELRRGNTLRGLTYDDETIEDVIGDLLTNVAGWGVKAEAGLGNTSRRFDGASILEAVRATVTGAGHHMRLNGDGRLEIGSFGADSGLRITNLRLPAVEALLHEHIALIERLQLIEDGYEIINWVEPVWGNGDAVLTLKRSTRTSPYTIQTMAGPNGKTIYYLTDADSIAAYGEVRTVARMTDAPYIAADSTALINAANVLYDWAAARLARISVPHKSYSVGGVKLDVNLKPGDMIRLVYKGWVWNKNARVKFVEIDDDFWIISVTENYDEAGRHWGLEISNVDEAAASGNDVLAEAIMGMNAQSTAQTFSAQVNRTEGSGAVDNATPLALTFTIGSGTVDIGDATLTVSRDSSAGPHSVIVFLDDAQVGETYLVDAESDNSFTLVLDEALIADMDNLRGDHTLSIECLYRSGTLTAAVEVVEIGLSVD